MEPLVEFVGWQIKPKEEISISEEVDEDSLVTVHITQLALGQAPSNDRHTVFIANESGKFAIGTLDKDKPHFSVDFMAAESDLIFSHTGSSDVYVTGYKTTSTMMSEYPYLDDDDDEEEDEEDDEAAPQAVPLNSKLQRRAALIRAQMAAQDEDDSEDDEEDDDDDDEEDDEDMNEEQQALLNAQEFSELEEDEDEEQAPMRGLGEDEDDDEDDDDEEDDDEDDDEEDVQLPGSLRGLAPAAAAMNGMGLAMMDDDDEDDEEDDEDDDDEDDEDDDEDPTIIDQKRTSAAINRQFTAARDADDEEDDDDDDEFDDDDDEDELDKEDDDEEDEPAANLQVGSKRAMVAKTPQPAKKAKVEGKEPKSAPAKMGKGSSEVAEFQAKLISTLKGKAPMDISQLGGLVKRPASVPKLKKFLEDNAPTFKVVGLKVSLA